MLGLGQVQVRLAHEHPHRLQPPPHCHLISFSFHLFNCYVETHLTLNYCVFNFNANKHALDVILFRKESCITAELSLMGQCSLAQWQCLVALVYFLCKIYLGIAAVWFGIGWYKIMPTKFTSRVAHGQARPSPNRPGPRPKIFVLI